MATIKHFTTPTLLAKAVADRIVNVAQEQIKKTDKFTIAISGGSTPNELFKLLATDEYSKKIDLKKSFIFWVDERCVPLNSNENNAHQAKKLWLDNVSIPQENVFIIPVNLTPEKAAESYEQSIKTFFKTENPVFDIILLGMGDDGHTASLFPYSLILYNDKNLVKNVFVEKLDSHRITLTASLINQAKNKLFLVSGNNKAEMFKKVIKGKYEPEKYPAQLIKNGVWYVNI